MHVPGVDDRRVGGIEADLGPHVFTQPPGLEHGLVEPCANQGGRYAFGHEPEEPIDEYRHPGGVLQQAGAAKRMPLAGLDDPIELGEGKRPKGGGVRASQFA